MIETTSPRDTSPSWGSFYVFPGDFNGDGRTDLVFNSTCQKNAAFDSTCTAGDANLVYSGLASGSGTFTLGESEWDELVRVLSAGLNGRLEIAVGPLDERLPTRGRAARRRPSTAA